MGRTSKRRKRTTQLLPTGLRPLLPLAIATMLIGVGGGLARMGVPVGPSPSSAVAWHGALLVFGFVGVLVSLERAVVLRRPWAFASPLLAVLGSALLIFGFHRAAGVAWIAAALVSVEIVRTLLVRRSSLATTYMLVSMLCWLGGAIFWTWGLSLGTTVTLWAAFVVLMVMGERIQFGKVHKLQWARRLLAALLTLMVVGCLTSVAAQSHGTMICGVAMTGMGLTMLVADASRRARRPGLLLFVTNALVLAYLWLAASGVLWASLGLGWAALAYDASIHTIFQGLLIGMVFAHAPMVFPALIGVRMPFHRGFYGHLILLHTSLVVRVAGDLTSSIQINRAGAVGTAAAMALFVVVSTTAMVRGRYGAPATDVSPARIPSTASEPAVSLSESTNTQPS